MAKQNLLTDRKVSTAKCPPDKSFVYLNDGSGLRLKVYAGGKKQWLYRITYDGAESTQSFGLYPTISLADARGNATGSRIQLAGGLNPVQEQRAHKRTIIQSYKNPFKDVAEEALKHYKLRPAKPWSDKHYARCKGILNNYIYKKMGNVPISQIDHVLILAVLKDIHKKGRYVTTHHAKNVLSSIFTYAIHSNLAKENPTLVLSKNTLLTRPKATHLSSIDIYEVGKFLCALEASTSLHFVTKAIVELHLYTALRVNSLRQARWCWLDLDKKTITIPAAFMKNRSTFTVPLPREACSIFKSLYALTNRGDTSYIFQTGLASIPISENTSTKAIKKLGFAATSHGMRTLMKRVLTKQNKFPPDAIERQLDHKRPPLDDAYMGGEDWLSERATMIQWYATWARKQKSIFKKGEEK